MSPGEDASLFARFAKELEAVQGVCQQGALSRLQAFWRQEKARQNWRNTGWFVRPNCWPPEWRPNIVQLQQEDREALDFSRLAGQPRETLLRQAAGLDLAVVFARYLVAWSGSALLLDADHLARGLYLLARELLILAPADALCPDLEDALSRLSQRADLPPGGGFLLVTGPSRTADIEKRLVIGVHGPQRMTVWLLS